MNVKRLQRIVDGEGHTAVSRPPNIEEVMYKINEIIEAVNEIQAWANL